MKKHRLPKGITLSYLCEAIDFDGTIIETADSKSELIETMEERSYDRCDYEIQWVVNDMNANGTILYNEGIGETKQEAIADFWRNYKN